MKKEKTDLTTSEGYNTKSNMIHKLYYYQVMSLEDLPGEEWKTIEFAPLYSVSNLGRVKAEACEKWYSNSKQLRFYPSHIKAQAINNKGYLVVSLINNKGKYKTYRVNRLVAHAFLPNPEKLPEACHINEDSLDNRSVNLKWGTHKENVNSNLRKIRISKTKGTHIKCDGHEFTSIRAAAKFYGIANSEMWKWITEKKPIPKEWQERGLKKMDKQKLYKIPHLDFESDTNFNYYMLVTAEGYKAYRESKDVPLNSIVEEIAENKKAEATD